MPLTWELKRPDSPVSRFMRDRFPDVAALRPSWRDQVVGRPTMLPDMVRPPWSTLGIAIDYRLRYYFAVTAPEEFAAISGMFHMGGVARVLSAENRSSELGPIDSGPEPGDDAIHVWAAGPGDGEVEAWAEARTAAKLAWPFAQHLGSTTARVTPVGRRLTMEDEADLCSACYVLALYEEPYRAGLRVRSPLYELPADANIANLLALAKPELVDDLRQLSWAFHDGYAALLSQHAVLNPTFLGSADIGGADADLIVGRCLVEIKTTKAPSLEPFDIYQLLGYVLLDYEDSFGIEEVGVYLARQALLVRWTLAGILTSLRGGRSPSVKDLRDEFRGIIGSRAS